VTITERPREKVLILAAYAIYLQTLFYEMKEGKREREKKRRKKEREEGREGERKGRRKGGREEGIKKEEEFYISHRNILWLFAVERAFLNDIQ
jgi:hypothetical protein